MIRLTTLFAIVASVIVLFVQSVLAAPPVGYNLVWNDEFNGTSLDTSRWSIRTGQGRDDWYTANAISVSDGMMTIKTYTEGSVHYNGWIDTGHLYNGSTPKFMSKKGYYEARINFHTTPGMWSAFWMQSPGMHPYSGIKDPAINGTEIDIQEHRANGGSFDTDDNVDDLHSALHWGGYNEDHESTSKHVEKSGSMGNDQWHTFAVLWTDTSYTFYFDNVAYWTTTSAISNALEYMILSSEAQDNSWAGVIPSGGYGSFETSTTNMQVDYVHYYKVVQPGDTDYDGDVDLADLGNLATNYNAAGNADWPQGDFDGDDDVDLADLGTLATYYQGGQAQALADFKSMASVPEPGAVMTCGMLALATLLHSRAYR